MTDTPIDREAVERRKVELPDVPLDNELECAFGEGVTYAIQIVAESLGTHPDEFSWDAATEEFEGDVRSIVSNMLNVITEDHHQLRALLDAKEAAEAKLAVAVEGLEYVVGGEMAEPDAASSARDTLAEIKKETEDDL